jgi:hypothetical protein
MPDMQHQIDALREAFSADINKPFVLKPSFPYGSPATPVHNTPPRSNPQYRQGGAQNNPHQSLEQHHASQPQVSRYTSHPISPPVSAGGVTDPKSDSPAVQSLVMMASGQQRGPPQAMNVGMTDQSSWNPSKIFE